MDKKVKFGLIAICSLLVVAIVFASCSGDDSEEKSTEKEAIISPFDTPKNRTNSSPSESRTTRPEATPDVVKNALLELPVSGQVDFYYPENYLSPRYEAIYFGDLENGDDLETNYLRDSVAITELNNPENSDLSPEVFDKLRNLIIDVAKAEQTSIGINKYPRYFTQYSTPDTCVEFTTNAAGVISMPYPGDSSWYLGVINWTAKCFPFGKDEPAKTNTFQQKIYIQKVGGSYIPAPITEIPRKSLDEFAL